MRRRLPSAAAPRLRPCRWRPRRRRWWSSLTASTAPCACQRTWPRTWGRAGRLRCAAWHAGPGTDPPRPPPRAGCSRPLRSWALGRLGRLGSGALRAAGQEQCAGAYSAPEHGRLSWAACAFYTFLASWDAAAGTLPLSVVMSRMSPTPSALCARPSNAAMFSTGPTPLHECSAAVFTTKKPNPLPVSAQMSDRAQPHRRRARGRAHARILHAPRSLRHASRLLCMTCSRCAPQPACALTPPQSTAPRDPPLGW
jgi:hypothetical protein